jgi:hypothetical protein
LDALVAVEPDREPQLAADQVVDEGVGRAGGAGADQARLSAGWLGQRQQRHRQHVPVILGGIGGGIAGPQQRRQCLAGPIAAVQPSAKRVEPEALLVGAGRALLVGVGLDQGRVHVDDQRPRRSSPQRPGPLADPGQRRPQRRHLAWITAHLPCQHPPGGRGRGDLAKQVRLLAQAGKIAHTVATVGQHHHQVPQHLPTVTGAAATTQVGATAKLAGQAQPVRQLAQQRCPDVATDALAVGDHFESGTRLGSLHRQGDPPGLGLWP